MNERLQSRIDEATDLLEQGQFVPAHFAIKKVLRQEPDNIAALIVKAQIQLRSGKQPDSVDTINGILELEPVSFNSKMQLRLADLCFENELFFWAAKLYEWVRSKKRSTDLSLYRSGICMRRLGSMYSAEQRLLECVESRPDVAASYLQLGHVYKATGHNDRAVHYYKKYLSLSADEKGTGYWSLADLKSYSFSDAEVEAMKYHLKKAQEDLPQSSALHFSLGYAAEQRKDYSEALDRYNKANAIQAKLKPFPVSSSSRLLPIFRTSTVKNSQSAPMKNPSRSWLWDYRGRAQR